MHQFLFYLVATVVFTKCNEPQVYSPAPVIHPRSVGEIPLPPQYVRIDYPESSQANYLRAVGLKPDKTVYLFNGVKKNNQSAQYAVLDMDAGDKDLQQCADAVMRLRAEYLWSSDRKSEIVFQFTNGFKCDYRHYQDGYRLKFSGNQCVWHKVAAKDESYKTFRSYLDLVYSYAGTRSLRMQLTAIDPVAITPGTVFLQTGDPYGHAVTVMDMAYHPVTKDTIFLLSQSYMPAQDIHILKNPMDRSLSPWYSTRMNGELVTPEWTFKKTDLMRF